MISQIVALELAHDFATSFPELDREKLVTVMSNMNEPDTGNDWSVMGEPSQESYLYWESNCVVYILEVGQKVWTVKTGWALCRYEYTSETLWKTKEFKSWEL